MLFCQIYCFEKIAFESIIYAILSNLVIFFQKCFGKNVFDLKFCLILLNLMFFKNVWKLMFFELKHNFVFFFNTNDVWSTNDVW